MALCSLTCWQHSVLEFLSCMGIDDVQKTSGNTMAITMTEDWVREVDALATGEFGRANDEVNRRRVAAEPVPSPVRARYRVSQLLAERRTDLPMVNAARVLAQRDASYHLGNSSRALNADFLEVIYRMAAGALPELDDFFVAGDQGPYSLDRVGLKVSRESVAWALERLRRDPSLLDYVSLAVPRGFVRPGAVAPGATVSLHATPDGPALLRFDADGRGGFAQRGRRGTPPGRGAGGAGRARAGHEGGPAGDAALTLRAVAADGSATELELGAVGHGAHGDGVAARLRRRRRRPQARPARRHRRQRPRHPRTDLARAGLPRLDLAGRRERGLPRRPRRGQRRPDDDLVGRGRPAQGLRRRHEVGEPAGRLGPLRHHRRRPAQGPRRRDQDQPGGEARQGRPSLGRQGHAHGLEGAQHPRRYRRAQPRPEARHLLDRGHAGRGLALAPLPQPLRHQDHRLDLHQVRRRRHVEQLRRRLPAHRRGSRRLGQLPRRLVARRLARHLQDDPAHAPRPHRREGRPGRKRRAAHDPRPERRPVRRPGRHAALRLGRPARRARHAQGPHRRRGRPLRGEHRQGGRVRLHAVRQLPPRLPARRHHDQAGAHGPERPRAHAPALAQLVGAEPREAGGARRRAQPRERGAGRRRRRGEAGRADRRHPPAAREDRPAGDAGLGRRGARPARRTGRPARPPARPARARLLPRRLARGHRARDRGRDLGVGAPLVQRRQQPRRRHRLRRLRAGARARQDLPHRQHDRPRQGRDAARRCSATSAAAASTPPTGPSWPRPTSPRAATSSACRSASATRATTAGVSPTCARTRATSTSSSSTSTRPSSRATAGACWRARTGCSGGRSTAT